MLRQSDFSAASRLFLGGEIACYFYYSIWWRSGIALWTGIAAGIVHLVVLVVLLRMWESSRAAFDLPGNVSQPGVAGGIVVVVLLPAALAQLAFVDQPVLSGPDEPVVLVDHLLQFGSLTQAPVIAQLALLACCLALYRVGKSLVTSAGAGASGHGVIKPLIVVAMLAVLYGLVESQVPFNWGLAERWPPLGTVLSVPFLYLLEDGIVAVRLLSVAFFLGTGYLVYRLAHEELGRFAALGAVLLLVTSPLFITYGHYAFREAGGVFFVTLGMHALAVHLRTGRAEPLAMVVAAATIGYLCRRPALLVLFVAAPMILMRWRLALFRRVNIGPCIPLVLGAAWMVLPWWVISASVRQYEPAIGQLLAVRYLSAYPAAFPALIGWPLTALAAIGCVVGALRRHRVVALAALWIVLFDLLFAMDVTAPSVVDRFAVHFVPPMALLGGCAARELARTGALSRMIAVIVVTAACVAPLSAWWRADEGRVSVTSPLALRHLDEPLLPFDRVADWLAGPDNAVILYQPRPWQSALPAYIRARELRRVTLVEAPWHELEDAVSPQEAMARCIEAQCDYLVEPLDRRGRAILHPGLTGADLEATFSAARFVRFENDHGSVWLVAAKNQETSIASDRFRD